MTRIVAPHLDAAMKTNFIEIITKLPANATLIQQRKGQTLYQVQIASTPYIIKHYALPTLASRLVTLCRFSRADRALKAGIAFNKLDIPTPTPHLAAISGIVLPRHTHLITNHFSGVQLPDFLDRNPEQTESLAKKTAHILHLLASHKISHGDFHVKNILVNEHGDISIIDLDGVRFHSLSHRHRRRYARDRNRIISSALKFIDNKFSQSLASLIPETLPTS